MDLNHVKVELAKRLSTKRYDHVLRVVETAKRLAELHGLSDSQAEQAALLHDIAKCMDKEELFSYLKRLSLDGRILSFHHELWHAPVGSLIAREEFGIIDEDILNAICYHTTGRVAMSPLEKLIYVADMIEPGRSFPGVDRLRIAAETNLDVAMAKCIIHSVQFLVEKQVPVYPDSIDCYNEHVHINAQIRKEQ